MNATNQAREDAERLVADIQSERECLSRFPHNPVAVNRRWYLLGVIQEMGLRAIDQWERISRKAVRCGQDSRNMAR